jgi:hypothetical protein
MVEALQSQQSKMIILTCFRKQLHCTIDHHILLGDSLAYSWSEVVGYVSLFELE